MLVETAVESLADALAAEHAGAGRIELCAHLAIGGITPSGGLIRAVLARVRVPVFVIVRPRGGDFVYGAGEVDVMLRDIALAKSIGVQGIVSGALASHDVVDQDVTRTLIESAAPLPFTFHRAFDLTRDLPESLDVLAALGAARLLTSGGAATAWEGRMTIGALVLRAGPTLTIMAGGGVRVAHASELARLTGVAELHVGPRLPVASAAAGRSTAVRISKGPGADHEERSRLDEAEVAAVVGAVLRNGER